jgi:hypothetical protein
MVQITKPVQERFRLVPSQIAYGFDNLAKPNDIKSFEVHGFLQGERTDRIKGLTLDHFDTIQLIERSENAKTKEEFFHAIGYRIKDQKYTILILKRKR